MRPLTREPEPSEPSVLQSPRVARNFQEIFLRRFPLSLRVHPILGPRQELWVSHVADNAGGDAGYPAAEDGVFVAAWLTHASAWDVVRSALRDT